MEKDRIKIVLDTNIFIRIFVGDIEEQMVECVRLLELLEEEGKKVKVYIPQTVVLEIGWVLGGKYYKFSRQKIAKALTSLNSDDIISADKLDFNKGIELFEKYKVKLGDAMIAASDVVQKEKAIIVSYDRDFDKIKGVKKMTPKEAAELIIKK
jgi:predicted nucleic-acid-binding protein